MATAMETLRNREPPTREASKASVTDHEEKEGEEEEEKEEDVEQASTHQESSRSSTRPPTAIPTQGNEASDEKAARDERQQQQDPTEWDSPTDPSNAWNWPLAKKIRNTAVPTFIALICTLGSSIITPGQSQIQNEFAVSSEVALLPYVLYVLGLAAGPMLSAPCSEHFGRRAVYWTGMPLFAFWTLGAGFANNITALAILRFLAGVCGSPGLSIGSATISDIWAPAERATPMAIYVVTPFLGPAVGPLVGGFVVQANGWRWTMWVLLFFTIAGLLPAAFMQESYKAAILKNRAKKRGLHYPGSDRTAAQTARFFLRSTVTRPVHMFCVEPVVLCFTTYIAINFGMLYGFFAAFPYVFETAYNFGLGSTGLTFLGLGVGVLVGGGIIVSFSRVVYRRQAARLRRAGHEAKVPPEHRLYIAMMGSVMLPCSLFWFGWSAQSRVHWICPVVAEALFGCGNLLVFMAAVMYVMDFYGPLYGASAMGANNLARYGLGAAFPLFIVQMYEGLGIGWATSLLGFLSVAMTPIPWVFFVCGPRLRAHSTYVEK